MTTGSKGLHVVLFLKGDKKFAEVRGFAKKIAEFLSNQNPNKFTIEGHKSKRKGRLYLDTIRNAYGQTSVAPYAVRAKEGAPIATPIDWEELEDNNLTSQSYRLSNIFYRLSQKDDPWKNVYQHKYSVKRLKQNINSLDLKD
jgi:bifunctional non-homologous end joining protein LigD